jgi:hypothetical protein
VVPGSVPVVEVGLSVAPSLVGLGVPPSAEGTEGTDPVDVVGAPADGAGGVSDTVVEVGLAVSPSAVGLGVPPVVEGVGVVPGSVPVVEVGLSVAPSLVGLGVHPQQRAQKAQILWLL